MSNDKGTPLPSLPEGDDAGTAAEGDSVDGVDGEGELSMPHVH